MRAAGLVIRDGLELNSAKTVRCHVKDDREKRGWYRLSEILIEGETYIVGTYGIWQGNDNGKVAVRPGRKVKMTREQRAAIAARIDLVAINRAFAYLGIALRDAEEAWDRIAEEAKEDALRVTSPESGAY